MTQVVVAYGDTPGRHNVQEFRFLNRVLVACLRTPTRFKVIPGSPSLISNFNENEAVNMAKTPAKEAISAPNHLKTATGRWFVDVCETYVLEPHHVRILTLAAESWDRGQAARAIIDKLGLTYTDRYGCPRPRPEIGIERDSRIAFARLLRELGLDIAGNPDDIRPPRVGGK